MMFILRQKHPRNFSWNLRWVNNNFRFSKKSYCIRIFFWLLGLAKAPQVLEQVLDLWKSLTEVKIVLNKHQTYFRRSFHVHLSAISGNVTQNSDPCHFNERKWSVYVKIRNPLTQNRIGFWKAVLKILKKRKPRKNWNNLTLEITAIWFWPSPAYLYQANPQALLSLVSRSWCSTWSKCIWQSKT